MNAAARLSISLLAALVLWLPTFTATMRGDLDLFDGAVRFLAAFVLSRVAVGGISRLIDSYAAVPGEPHAIAAHRRPDAVDEGTASAA